jgi:predicted metal-binding membrane protein
MVHGRRYALFKNSGLGYGLLLDDVLDVGHHDGRDDGSLSYADDSHLCRGCKEGGKAGDADCIHRGYIFMWVVFSLLVTLLQWQLDKAALLSPMMVANSPRFGAGLLIAAGIYQWLPVKDRCLTHCRSPFHFISTHWRQGNVGAFLMGISHGVFCIGCCWVLMLLLFVGGVMNIFWISVLTIFVLIEKVLPLGTQG